MGTRLGPAVKVVPVTNEQDDRELVRLVVAYRHGTTHSFFSGLTSLYHSYGLHSSHKYIERYSNGLCSFSIYLFRGAPAAGEERDTRSLMDLAESMARDCSLAYALPRSSLSTLMHHGDLNKRQTAYAYVLQKFAFQFFNSCTSAPVRSSQASGDATQTLLSKLSADIKREMMTESRVQEVIEAHLDIIRDLYAEFEARFLPGGAPHSPSRLDNIVGKVARAATTTVDAKILSCMCLFNQYVLKTNFF